MRWKNGMIIVWGSIDEKLAYARVMQIIILADKSIMNSCNKQRRTLGI
jgi:hypothetical protein